MEEAELLIDGPKRPRATLVLAHGAGAPMDSPFMNAVARGLAVRKLRVVRFEFPYMAARRAGGSHRAPNAGKVLEQSWRETIEALGGGAKLVIGGKSLGGRIASMIADDVGARGLVCLGYPFHPPGRPYRLRTAHLETLKTPALIVQGTRDPFGTPDEVSSYGLPDSIRVAWLPDGDHSFKPRKSSGRTLEQNLQEAADRIAGFVADLTGS